MDSQINITEQAIREAMINGPKLSDSMSNEEAVETALSVLKGERRLRDVRGLTDKQMEAVYAHGYNFFTAGANKKAENIFSFLVTFDPFTSKYWKALGAVRYNMKEYIGAVNAYIQAAKMDIHDANLMIRIAQCHVGLGNKQGAIDALEVAIEISELRPDNNAEAKVKAQALLDILQKA